MKPSNNKHGKSRNNEMVVHILTERKNGSKKLIFKSFFTFCTKGFCGLLRESTFTPNDVPVITSML